MASDPVEFRQPTGAEVVTMSADQWVEKITEDLTAQATEIARRLVEDMIAAGALTVGPRRRWTVVHDDPEALARYEMTDVYAPTPELAMRRGAFLAILADPYATMRKAWGGRQPTMGEREQVARSLVEHAARWCTVTETTEKEGVPGGEAGE